MQTEFQMQLKSGHVVSAVVETEVTYGCDCSGPLHPHVDYHEIIECLDAYNGLDIQMTDEIRQEIELYADDFVYDVIERQNEVVA